MSLNEACAAAEVWNAPTMDGRLASARRAWRTAGELEAVERQTYAQAESAGRAAGLAAAQQDFEARLRNAQLLTVSLEKALSAVSRPLGRVDEQVHEQIVHLAMAVARGLVRRELRVDPSQVIGIVRETVALLPAAARGVRVVLHPEDAALVRERLAAPHADQAWSITEDPVLSRGDCRVYADYAQIDARLESRLNAVIASLLGDDREQVRAEPAS
jgi:flagellar assembly protein FliH